MPAQNVELNLGAANMNQFRGKLYCYGSSAGQTSSYFKIYQLDQDLRVLDSTGFRWPEGFGTDLIPAWSDTLHGFLNIYVPEGRTQRVSLYRFNARFELQKEVHNLEVTKINPISGFENKLFYDRDMVYAIQTQKDSSGQGFYLNKYQLKKEYIGFEYDFVWQFPFERRNIRSAEVIFANPEQLMVFVHVFAGSKKGQWILKINARTGRLIRGTRLGDKDSEDTYMYGAVNFEKQSKSLMLIGHKYNPSQYTYTSGKLMAPATASVQLYLNVLDSIGDPLIRQDLKISFSPQKPGT
ncbi:MAG TPA: hypothetical protein PLQ93_11825, partial [Bacteroidia bacterium]|nr:hypothetical protein [Bacteroidia bacterium]